MEGPPRKPTYEKLEALCKELQSRVTRGISLQQELISIKDELDQELNRFRLIQEFGEIGLFQENIQEFGAIANEYFIQAFEQPHCLLAEFRPALENFYSLSVFGFPHIDVPSVFSLPLASLKAREGFLLCQRPAIHKALAFLQLSDALIAPLLSPDGSLRGIVICGQQAADRRFYNPIHHKGRHAFTVMATKVGYLLHNFRINEQLKKEVEERRRVEKMLEKKAQDLLHSNAELEQFAYVVSHDLKAPLHNIKGFARMLKKKYGESLPATGREYLEIIWKEVNRFETIIDDLLAYARLSSSSQQQEQLVDFNAIVKKVMSHIHLLISQRNASIQVKALPQLPAQGQQMEQLFQNLIVNAIKFTPPDRAPLIEIQARKTASGYCFTVRDEGIGMDEALQAQAFALFKRLDNADGYEGNGLGLSICKKIVEQHGGRIWARSQGPGKGAILFFTLPLQDSSCNEEGCTL